MRLALAIASIIVLVIHAIVFYDQFFHSWEKHQTAYFDQARGMAKTDSERAAMEGRSPRIEQTLVTQFGEMRVDRCQTCHIAIDDPRFEAYAHPLRSHSYSEALGDKFINGHWERRHKFSDFGCTICHDGQGRGLKTYYGHGEDHYWPEPLLGYVVQEDWKEKYKAQLFGKEYLQVNCAQCHTEENFASTPQIAEGRKLFFSKNCYSCHRIEGISNGTLGPDLSEVGKKFKLDYIWESIVDPRANLATSIMPDFKLNDNEVKSLAIFLKSRKGINFVETSLDRYREHQDVGKIPVKNENASNIVNLSQADLIARGEQLFKDKSCIACHKMSNQDGGIAPDLSFEGLLKDESWLNEHFLNPRARITDSIMPTFSFPNSDFQAISAYLTSLNKPPSFSNTEETYKGLCARCHGDKGNGNGAIAIYLDPSPRDFTKSGFINSKSEDRLINSIKKGVAGTSMPAWEKVLSDDQIKVLLDYIQQNFVKEARKPLKAHLELEHITASSESSIKHGEQLFLQRCTGCHSKKADGKGPNSLDILPRPRNLRNREFIESIQDRRLAESIMYGVQGTAMPAWIDYGLTKNDVGDLINYIRNLNQKKK